MRPNIEDMLIRHEGMKPMPYQDTKGIWTVGVGHNLQANPMPDNCIMELLHSDIATAVGGLNSFTWFAGLNDARQAALIDMVFNLGIAGFSKFTLTIKHFEVGDYAAASKEMLNSQWAKQVGARATELSTMIATGAWV